MVSVKESRSDCKAEERLEDVEMDLLWIRCMISEEDSVSWTVQGVMHIFRQIGKSGWQEFGILMAATLAVRWFTVKKTSKEFLRNSQGNSGLDLSMIRGLANFSKMSILLRLMFKLCITSHREVVDEIDDRNILEAATRNPLLGLRCVSLWKW